MFGSGSAELFLHRSHHCFCCRDSKLRGVVFNVGDVLPATSLELELGKMHEKAMSKGFFSAEALPIWEMM